MHPVTTKTTMSYASSSNQRVAAQVEEAVVEADVVAVEDFAPDPAHGLRLLTQTQGRLPDRRALRGHRSSSLSAPRNSAASRPLMRRWS